MPTDELPDVLPEFALLPQHQPEPALFGDGESASEPECPADDDGEQDDDAGNALFPGLDFGLTLGCLGFVSVKTSSLGNVGCFLGIGNAVVSDACHVSVV